MKPVRGNCIPKKEIRQRINDVLDYVDNIVCKTLGPCGHNAIIQQADKVFMTKDGWTVSTNIHMENIIDNAIKSLIESCCQSVVLKAGDGTTTVTKAANTLNKALLNYNHDDHFTIREVQETLEKATKAIAGRIRDNSIKITNDNLYEAIKGIALVSTNWDEDLSEIIATIYKETHNTIIKVEDSGTEQTSYRIINGYELAGDLLLPDFYLTDRTTGECNIEHPYIMVFDYKIQDKYFIPLFALGNILRSMNKTLVVMAPDFETTFIKHVESVNMAAANKGEAYMNLVPISVVNNYLIDKACISDFSVLTGACAITRHNDDIEEMFDDITRCAGLAGKDVEPVSDEERDAIMHAIPAFMDAWCGTCDVLTAKERHIVAGGLTNKNQKLVDERIEKLEYEISNKTKECDALTMLTDDIRQKRIRLAKLKGSIGVICVGGHGSSELRARKDALDDAIRACEEAYHNGYNVGSSLSIIRACREELEECDNESFYSDIVSIIESSFEEVVYTLFRNKGYSDLEDNIPIKNIEGKTNGTIDEIIDICVENGWGYNLLTEKFDKDNTVVINPTSVDIEVLNGCLRLALVCNTSDQFLFSSYEGFDTVYDTDDHKPVEKDIDEITTNILNVRPFNNKSTN